MKFLPFFTVLAFGAFIETVVAMTEDDEKWPLVLSVRKESDYGYCGKNVQSTKVKQLPLNYNDRSSSSSCIVESDVITLPYGYYKLCIAGENKSYSFRCCLRKADKNKDNSLIFERGIEKKDGSKNVRFDISAPFKVSENQESLYFAIYTNNHNEYEQDQMKRGAAYSDEFTLEKCEIVKDQGTWSTCLVN
ncbi:MAG: hypothetical protein BGO67_00910 [Alphaproteobacteria bacterium 41-28]|nr:MAG: hypothetical protein BGO67_00910 [Alphaproteobacteria bacterium 41-28]